LPKGVETALEQTFHLTGVADIHWYSKAAGSECTDFRRGRQQILFTAAGDHHIGAQLRKRLGDRLPDATPSAGDQRSLSCKQTRREGVQW